MDLPRGTVTFLFTDIEGSTRLWERDRQAMATAVARHLTLLRAATEAHNGVLFKVVGDAVQAAFPTAPDAIAAALDAQRGLVGEAWDESVGPLRVRMALHTAAATPQDGDYLAPGLNRLARLLAAGHGGQTLLSLATQDLARDSLPPGAGLRDLGEHPLRDLYRPERVFQLLHPDLPADFPPIRTRATRSNNLPVQPTPFLGREEQIARVVDLLSRDEVRLLTITGPGGVGKTRLGLQAAADLLESFPDGVWFVDLSVLDDPALVFSSIAAVLGVREEGSGLTERLASILSGKRLLLALDNFERVIDGAQAVSELLALSPGVKVLATSRVPLHAYGEREYPLAPLPLPDLTRLPPLEQMTQYEAMRLFIERAQAVKPDFTVTTANAPTVAEICHRLDGLPLAIELAAALVKMLPPQALLKRLEQRLPLLTGGARTLPARQHTMRNAIAWSFDLLTPSEQTLFRRLAVFVGGCTLAAAEAVVNSEGTHEVFAGIASLVDSSLLRQDEGAEDEPHFRMLETVREFGLERLETSGEAEETRTRHAAWCQELAEFTDRQLGGPNHRHALERMATEYGNVRAALLWHLEHGTAEEGLRLTASLWRFLADRGHLSEGRQWQERLLAADPMLPSHVRADALWLAAYLALFAGDYPAVAAFSKDSLALAQQGGNGLAVAKALFLLGNLPQDGSDSRGNLALLEEALKRFRTLGNSWWVAETMQALGRMARTRGDLPTARAFHQEELSLWREQGNMWGTAWALLSLGELTAEEGDTRQAAALLRQSLQMHADHGDHLGIYYCLLNLGQWAAGRYPEAAARVLGAATALREARGALLQPEHRPLHERALSQAQSNLGEAAFGAAWTRGQTMPLVEAVDEALTLANEIMANQRHDLRIGKPGEVWERA